MGGHSHDERDAEEGHAHAHNGHKHVAHVADESGNVADVLPQNRIANWPKTKGAQTGASESSTAVESPKYAKHKHTRSKSRGYSSFEDIQVNPSAFRKSIIEASRLEALDSDEGTGDEGAVDEDRDDAHGHSHTEPLLKGNGKKHAGYGSIKRKSIDHRKYKHAQPKEQGKGHGHSHGDLNMRGIFLHVMGDALGNVGVIATALIIWLTHFPGRYYFDPGISLVITIIILYSAIPLCKAASRILLQAVPVGLSIDEITDDIESLPRVLSAHHLHVWQLSDTKLVASLHVKVDCDVEGAGSASYMHLAREIRGCLHGYGIHSSTIQPEFTTPQPDSGAAEAGNGHLNAAQAGTSSKAASVNSEGPTCLLECGDKCAGSKMCCPTDGKNGSQNGKK